VALNEFRLIGQELLLWTEADDLRGEALSLAAIGIAYDDLADWSKAADSCDRALRIFRVPGELLFRQGM
jgi:hypothetical protein